jgi:hypothetical protein
MKDFNFAEKLAQRKEKAEAQAKKYFYDVKQRKAYYWAEGSTCDDLDNHNEVFLHFTDEEIARIKELIINDVNDSHTVPQPVSTVKEALDFRDIVFLHSGHNSLLGTFILFHDLSESIVLTLLLLLLRMGLIGWGIVE